MSLACSTDATERTRSAALQICRFACELRPAWRGSIRSQRQGVGQPQLKPQLQPTRRLTGRLATSTACGAEHRGRRARDAWPAQELPSRLGDFLGVKSIAPSSPPFVGLLSLPHVDAMRCQ